MVKVYKSVGAIAVYSKPRFLALAVLAAAVLLGAGLAIGLLAGGDNSASAQGASASELASAQKSSFDDGYRKGVQDGTRTGRAAAEKVTAAKVAAARRDATAKANSQQASTTPKSSTPAAKAKSTAPANAPSVKSGSALTLGVPYIVKLARGGNGSRYTIVRSFPVRTGFSYRMCPSGDGNVCEAPNG
jgi:hypothetical protein